MIYYCTNITSNNNLPLHKYYAIIDNNLLTLSSLTLYMYNMFSVNINCNLVYDILILLYYIVIYYYSHSSAIIASLYFQKNRKVKIHIHFML